MRKVIGKRVSAGKVVKAYEVPTQIPLAPLKETRVSLRTQRTLEAHARSRKSMGRPGRVLGRMGDPSDSETGSICRLDSK